MITHRPRRLRVSPAMRSLVAENHLHAENLILPVFVKEGARTPTPIKNMKGVVQHTFDSLRVEVDRALQSGIGGIMVFAIPEKRDESGSEALNPDGILQTSVRKIREQAGDRLVVLADLCLDEFTSHGHCGLLAADGSVDNDATLEIYSRMAVQLAQSGAHMLGASGMMDGQVGAARKALDQAGFVNTSVMAYAAKYASAFYGPFRDAVDSQLKGDRKSYQQDPSNLKEALREIELDVHAASQVVNLPIASYIISGEMAMIESASAAGAINREQAILEILMATKRAGATIICTYWAIEVAEMLRK